MTILVTLALARGPIRAIDLWKHIGRKYVGCVTAMNARGLVRKWAVGRNEVYVALNPAHPAVEPLVRLLLQVAKVYKFSTPAQCDLGREVPSLPWLEKNGQFTFGDHIRTFVLLLVYILGEAQVFQISRCLPTVGRRTVAHVLWMYTAFGILRRDERESRFSLNREHVLSFDISDVLAALDKAMPYWRMVVEIQERSKSVPRHEIQTGRKQKRWKW